MDKFKLKHGLEVEFIAEARRIAEIVHFISGIRHTMCI